VRETYIFKPRRIDGGGGVKSVKRKGIRRAQKVHEKGSGGGKHLKEGRSGQNILTARGEGGGNQKYWMAKPNTEERTCEDLTEMGDTLRLNKEENNETTGRRIENTVETYRL